MQRPQRIPNSLRPLYCMKQWRNFEKVLDRAKLACKNSGYEIVDYFGEVSKIVEAGATSKQIMICKTLFYKAILVENGRPALVPKSYYLISAAYRRKRAKK